MSSEILAVKMDIFSEKNLIQKSWSVKNSSVPQTRRQVSATAILYNIIISEPRVRKKTHSRDRILVRSVKSLWRKRLGII